MPLRISDRAPPLSDKQVRCGLSQAVSQVLVFVAAGAKRNADRFGRLDNMTGPFPIENLDVIVVRQRLLTHQRSTDLGFARENRVGKLVIFVHVLVETDAPTRPSAYHHERA